MKVIKLQNELEQVIELASNRNRHAQQEIYSRFAPKMLGVCRQYIKDVHQAEDVMICAFLKVFENLPQYSGVGNFEGWIRRITINEAISYLRVQKKAVFIDDLSGESSWSEEQQHEFTVNEIQELIDAMPDGYRMVFNLYVIEGYKHHEIAKLLDISEGTSKSQLSHARRLLQEQIIKRKMSNHETA